MDALSPMHSAMLDLARRSGRDLTTRQMCVMMQVYLTDEPQTVKKLAMDINVSRPAVCRALDDLQERGMLYRVLDASDRRVVILRRTPAGQAWINDLRAAAIVRIAA